MQIWPGRPYPLGATYDGAGVNFALFSEVADKVELCLIADDGSETRVELVETDAFVHHAYLPGHPARPALRLPRARAVRAGAGAPVQPREAAARPLRQGGRGPDRRPRVAVLLQVQQAQDVQRPGQPRPHHAVGGRQPVLRLGQRPAPRARVPRDGHLRGARQGSDDDPSRRTRGDPRHVRRHLPPGHDRAPQGPRRHRDRADAGAPVRAGHHAGGPGAVELLGLQHDRLLRAAQRLLRHRPARPAGAGVQVDGEGAARGRHRGDPRRGLQPHRRGQPPRARRWPSAASTTPPTTGSSTTTSSTTTTPPAPGTPC